MYDVDTNIIATNITQILQESIDTMAPIRRIQLSSKNTEPLSMSARQALVDRDHAHLVAKISPTVDNIRYHKHMRNSANSQITKERYQRKRKMFEEQTSDKKKWQKSKDETGQSKKISPSILREGTKIHTKPREFATALNRLYISTIRETIKKNSTYIY